MPWPPSRENRGAVTVDGVLYEPGAKFRVVREGARITGLTESRYPGVMKDSRRYLSVGDVIECAGYGAGWGSDPGFGVEFRDPDMGLVEFHPWIGGPFNYRPEPGYLEPVE